MPNWVEGKLKIRGKPEDIKRWVEECLHCYHYELAGRWRTHGACKGCCQI